MFYVKLFNIIYSLKDKNTNSPPFIATTTRRWSLRWINNALLSRNHVTNTYAFTDLLSASIQLLLSFMLLVAYYVIAIPLSAILIQSTTKSTRFLIPPIFSSTLPPFRYPWSLSIPSYTLLLTSSQPLLSPCLPIHTTDSSHVPKNIKSNLFCSTTYYCYSHHPAFHPSHYMRLLWSYCLIQNTLGNNLYSFPTPTALPKHLLYLLR